MKRAQKAQKPKNLQAGSLPAREGISGLQWGIEKYYKTPSSFIIFQQSPANLHPHKTGERALLIIHSNFDCIYSYALQTPLDFKEMFTSLFGWHKVILNAFPALTSYSQACRLDLPQSHLNFLHISMELLHHLFPSVANKCKWPSVFALLPKAVYLESQKIKRVYNKFLYLFH